jgi:hypothetical protein
MLTVAFASRYEDSDDAPVEDDEEDDEEDEDAEEEEGYDEPEGKFFRTRHLSASLPFTPCTSPDRIFKHPPHSLNRTCTYDFLAESAPATKKRKTAPASKEELPAKPAAKPAAKVDNGAEPGEDEEEEEEEEEGMFCRNFSFLSFSES